METLKKSYLEILKKLDWNVCDYTDDRRVELEKYSSAGEDFVMCVEIEDFPEAVEKYADDFDIDEHIGMWIEAKNNGVKGIPSARELIQDAEDIQEMLNELATELSKEG